MIAEGSIVKTFGSHPWRAESNRRGHRIPTRRSAWWAFSLPGLVLLCVLPLLALAGEPRYGETPPPAPGVHPRICLSPGEVEVLRARIEREPAKSGYEGCRKQVTALSSRAGDNLLALIERLESGQAIGELEQQRLAGTLRDAALVALLDDQAGPPVRRALLAFVRHVAPDAPKRDHSRTDPGIAFAYDWAFRHLNDQERAEVRGWLVEACRAVEATLEEAPWGFKTGPDIRHRDNWTPFITGAFGLSALAIEGEDGFEPRWFTKSAAAMEQFLKEGIGAEGAPAESIHYFAYGMANGAHFLDAMARRERPVWTQENLRGVPSYWLHDMFPFGPDFNSLQDTRDLHMGCEDIYHRLHLARPLDPVMQRVYQQYLENPNTTTVSHSGRALWAEPSDPTVAAKAATEPPGRYFATNGLLYARSDWLPGAAYFSFQSDPLIFGPSHAHADRNGFTFAALGRLWAMDGGGWLPQDIFHNTVLIDGRGQGLFPQAGRIVDFVDQGWAAAITGDAKLAYDWRSAPRPDNSPAHRNEWRQIGGIWSTAHNPVQAAFRTVVFVRGPHPYLLVSDNIRKDDAAHSYEWRMLTPLSSRIEMLPDAAGVRLSPVETAVAPLAFQPAEDQDPQPLRIAFALPQAQPVVLWILAGHQTWEPWNWSLFVSLDQKTRERVLMAAGDSALPHWQRLTPAKGELTLPAGPHDLALEAIGTVRVHALLVAPPGFDPREPMAKMPEEAQLIPMQPDLLPAGWRLIDDSGSTVQCDVRVLAPADVKPGAALLHCVRPDDRSDRGHLGLVRITANTEEPRFRVLLWPHRQGEKEPQIVADALHARLTWPDGTVDEWTFGSKLEGRRRLSTGAIEEINLKARD